MRRILGLTLVLLGLASGAMAQVSTGNIYGNVSDASGSTLPGATVTLTGDVIGARTITTTASGDFRFVNLDPGMYKVAADLAGFTTVTREIRVLTGSNVNISLSMKVAGVEETITVTAETPIVDTKKVGTGTTLTKEELSQIPNSRDPWAVLRTIPGVLVDRVNIAGNESGQQSSFQGKGAAPTDAMWNLDGVIITDMAAVGASPDVLRLRLLRRDQRHDRRPGPQGRHGRHRPQLRDQARHQRVPRRPSRLLHPQRSPDYQHQGTSSRPTPAFVHPNGSATAATRPTTSTRSPTTASTSAGRSSRTSCGSGVPTASRTSATSATNQTKDKTLLKDYNGKLNWQHVSNDMFSVFYFLGAEDRSSARPARRGKDVDGTRPASSGTRTRSHCGKIQGMWKVRARTTSFSPNFFMVGVLHYNRGFGFKTRSTTATNPRT